MKKLLSLIFVSSQLIQTDPINPNTFNFVQRANRKTDAKNMRVTTESNQAAKQLFVQPVNGDEQRYADKRGSYGKGLTQLANGFVDPTAFNALVRATQSTLPTDFNAIPMGTNPVQRRLHSPQAGISLNMLGADSAIYSIPAPPTITSAEKAGEEVELYAMATMRDINFTAYEARSMIPNSEVSLAIDDLNILTDFKGPKNAAGLVDAQTLYRENFPALANGPYSVLNGPYISQFFYMDIPVLGTNIAQKYTLPLPIAANDFMTSVDEWKAIQRGQFPTRQIQFDQVTRYITTIRDLTSYVHTDPPQWPYTCTLLILLNLGQAALDPANPYLGNPTQEQFVDFFEPQYASLLASATELALRAAWYQKWFVNRTLRPEFFGFLVNDQRANGADLGLNEQVITSPVLDRIFAINTALNAPNPGTYLLSQAFPEGSPLHPSYPAGHASVAGACVTVLKAIFNEDFVLTNPVVPTDSGLNLEPYVGAPLTIGGELNKFGANIAIGRNMAGVHYRSDGHESMLLGEQVALALLEDWAYNNHIPFRGFSVTKFDGTRVTVGATRIAEHY